MEEGAESAKQQQHTDMLESHHSDTDTGPAEGATEEYAEGEHEKWADDAQQVGTDDVAVWAASDPCAVVQHLPDSAPL